MSEAEGAPRRRPRALQALVVAAGLAILALLGLRTITSLDLGYHLAYGEAFLETGELVDHNAFLYTLPGPDMAPSERPAPGPSAWYDEDGRYRFANANWLSQVALAGAHRLGGVVGLTWLRLLLVTAVGLLAALTMRRAGVPAPALACGLLLFGFVAYPRFNLRPELFGYLLLAAQMALLAGLFFDERRERVPSWRTVVALIALQGVFVNFHSYFLLGAALSGALLVEACIHAALPALATDEIRARAKRLLLLLLGQALVSLANPWTAKLALLPIETLLYLREHEIGGAPGAHPWSFILEFRSTFGPGFPARPSDYGLLVVLALAAVGAIAAAAQRRFAVVFVLFGMSAVAFSMWRNVAGATLVLVPFALAALASLRRRDAGVADAERSPGHAARLGAVAALIAAAVFAFEIVTDRFYLREGEPSRFGAGFSRTALPITAAEWLDEHVPGLRPWCDMSSSSTLHFFTRPHRDVPLVTNTWAFPPAILGELGALRAGEGDFHAHATRHGVEAVLLRVDWSRGLFLRLAQDPRWILAHVEGRHAVFLRAEGRSLALARALDLRTRELDVDAFLRELRALDPELERTWLPAGRTLAEAGVTRLAIPVLEAALAERPKASGSWVLLGTCFVQRALEEHDPGSAAAVRGLESAERAYARALELRPGSKAASSNLDSVRRLLADRR